jgi:hypothetical protein
LRKSLSLSFAGLREIQAREIAKVLPGCTVVSFRGLGRAIEVAKVLLALVYDQIGSPLSISLVPTHTLESRLVSN